MFKTLLCCSFLAMLVAVPVAAHAAPLTGSTVAGTLVFSGFSTNQFSPATAVVGPGVEFTYTGSANIDTANFNAIGLTVDDNCYDGSGIAGRCNLNNGYVMTFTDTDFLGGTFTTSNAFNNIGFTYSLTGDVLTLTYSGATLPAGDNLSTFAFTPAVAATPEPESLLLLSTGLLGIAGVARRRFRSR